ncbi:MAG: efflux RND transporter permease subunit, partial [Bacteroidota bacterium]
MDLTRYAIENKVVTLVTLVVIAFSGYSAYQSLPRAEDPGFLIRVAVVTSQFPGASPQRVELLVTDKLEKAIQEIPEVETITSESRTGLSIVQVSIKENVTALRPVFDNLRRKVERASRELPDGVVPIVNDEFGDVFGILVSLTADGFSYAELKDIADQVRDALLKIDDVAKVDIHGVQDERVFVEFDNARLADLGLSVAQLQNILQSSNIIIPGGAVETRVETISLEPTGNFESVDAIRRTVITLPRSGDVVSLGDIARVHRAYLDPPRTKVLANGQDALSLGISMRAGGDIIQMGTDVKAVLSRLENQYPVGVAFDVVAFQPDVVEGSISSFVESILQAIAIVLVCMLAFLGIRTGLIVASLIPMAMLMALMVMGFLDIGLNKMSLAALIIALGLLVDNAIVMSESILTRMQSGEPALDATLGSAKELRVPLLISSLTTVAAFLPIVLAESSVGEYTAPIAQVIAITLISSWILAITMIPLFCMLYMKVKQNQGAKGGEFDTRFYRGYRGLLLALVKRPLLTIAGALALLVGSFGLFGFVEQNFFPSNNEPLFTGEFEFPYGTSFAYTETAMRDIERYMVDEMSGSAGRLSNWVLFVGDGAPRFKLTYNPEQPRTGYASLVANAESFDEQAALIAQLRQYVDANYPEIDVTLERLATGPSSGSPVEVRLLGEDQDVLYALADEIKAELASLPGTRNISDDWGQQIKKLVVRINETRARRAGVSNQDIAVSLQAALSGYATTDYREGDESIPVVIRSEASDREDIGKLQSINVYAQSTGQNVPLSQVADVSVQFEPSKILRRDRSKALTVTSDLDERVEASAFDIVAALDPWLVEQQDTWPVGYTYELGGEFESSAEANQSIGDKLPIAALLIVLLLVVQFNSLRKPLIILLTIPLGLIGVIIGLLI